jgi:hypothetical protein
MRNIMSMLDLSKNPGPYSVGQDVLKYARNYEGNQLAKGLKKAQTRRSRVWGSQEAKSSANINVETQFEINALRLAWVLNMMVQAAEWAMEKNARYDRRIEEKFDYIEAQEEAEYVEFFLWQGACEAFRPGLRSISAIY